MSRRVIQTKAFSGEKKNRGIRLLTFINQRLKENGCTVFRAVYQ